MCGRQEKKKMNVFVIHYWAACRVNRRMGIVMTTLLLAGWWDKCIWAWRSASVPGVGGESSPSILACVWASKDNEWVLSPAKPEYYGP